MEYKIIDEHKSRRSWKNTFIRKSFSDANSLYEKMVKRQCDLYLYDQKINKSGAVTLLKNNEIIKKIEFSLQNNLDI